MVFLLGVLGLNKLSDIICYYPLSTYTIKIMFLYILLYVYNVRSPWINNYVCNTYSNHIYLY